MKARWFQPHHNDSDYSRINGAIAFFRALFPQRTAAVWLSLANLTLDYGDDPGRYR